MKPRREIDFDDIFLPEWIRKKINYFPVLNTIYVVLLVGIMIWFVFTVMSIPNTMPTESH